MKNPLKLGALLSRVVNWWTSTPEKVSTLRRWDAAKTSRLNEGQWAGATAESVNKDLRSYQKTLRNRIALEAGRNPNLRGVIETHINDIVGPHGPRLQVRSTNPKYNTELEAYWEQWWAMPDAAELLSGVAKLRQWVRGGWLEGEAFEQIVSSSDIDASPALRIQSIAAERVETQLDLAGNYEWVMGVHRDHLGKPIEYSIRKGIDDLDLRTLRIEHDIIPAEYILHTYESEEPGQARGIPWAATQLQVIADIREFDAELLRLMHKAAHFGIVFETDFDDAPFLKLIEETEVESDLITAAPPHYHAKEIDPSQPTTDILAYRRERLRELGRPVAMPGMMVHLDSSKHNYSSARFESLPYWLAVNTKRTQIERQILNRLVDEIAFEGLLRGAITGPRPDDERIEWNWQKPKQVDDSKEAKGQQIRLQSMSATLRDETPDWESQLQQVARERELMKELGIPLPGSMPSTPGGLSGDSSMVAADDEEALKEALEELTHA